MSQWDNLSPWRDNVLQGEKERVGRITYVEQGRKGRQPWYLYPGRRNGMPISRHKCYLAQPLQVCVRCLALNKKLQNTQVRKIKSFSRDKEMTQMLEVLGNCNCSLKTNFAFKIL